MIHRLDDKSVVVIGATSGIGRGVAKRCVKDGARVVVAGRRREELERLVEECGAGWPVHTDIRNEASCAHLAEEVARLAVPIDLLVISAGVAPLRTMVRTGAEEWQEALSTNLVGIHRVIAALLEHLSPHGLVAAISSDVVEMPRSHLGAYGASKAALEHSMRQWQQEHPWLRFTVVSLGATTPTEFGRHFPSGELQDAFAAWTATGRTDSRFMNTDEICDVLSSTLSTLVCAPSVGMPSIAFRSPAPAEFDLAAATASASLDNPPS